MLRSSTAASVATGLIPLAAPIGLVATIMLVVNIVGGPVLQSVVLIDSVYLVLVLGTYIFIGNSGVVSFGQMCFMGVGAYTSALLTISPTLKAAILPDLPGFLTHAYLGFVPATLVAGGLTALLATLLGTALMRLSGISAGIASLALLLIAQNVIENSTSFTRGEQAMFGIPTDLTLPGSLAIVIAIMVLAFAYQTSRFGLRLKASREDELAARTNGIHVERERLLAFALSGFVCGVGGSMLAHYQGALSPTFGFFLDPTVLTMAMLVVGGLNSLSGAVVGTLVLSVVLELLRRVELIGPIGGIDFASRPGLDGIVFGVIMLVILIWRPGGVTGSREFRLPTRDLEITR